jgi:tetratricopeptide (TPR) repeat protein
VAARAYAEGLERRVQSDYPGAVLSFVAAASADGSFYPAHFEQARVWMTIGNRKQARLAAQIAVDVSRELPVAARRRAELLLRRAEDDEPGATRLAEQLFDQFPDDPQLAIELSESAKSAEAGLAVVSRWRRALAGVPERLDVGLWEARWSWEKDRQAGSEMFDKLERRATELGARVELGDILLTHAEYLSTDSGDPEAPLADRAEAAFRAAGYLEGLAQVGLHRALFLANPTRTPAPEAMAAYRDVLALYRRLGLSSLVNETSIALANGMYGTDPVGAGVVLREVEESLASLGEPTPVFFLNVRSWTHWRMGELREARRRNNELKARLGADVYRRFTDSAFLEGLLLTEEDRLGEARAAFEVNAQNLRSLGLPDVAFKNQGLGCLTSCQEGHSDMGLRCLDELKSGIDSAKRPMPAGNFQLRRVRTECLLDARRFEAARASLEKDWAEVVGPPFTAAIEIARARLDAVEGREHAALIRLRKARTLATDKRWALQRLEAELRIGEIELRTQRHRGQARLVALEAEATRTGFLRIARLARSGLDGIGGR